MGQDKDSLVSGEDGEGGGEESPPQRIQKNSVTVARPMSLLSIVLF